MHVERAPEKAVKGAHLPPPPRGGKSSILLVHGITAAERRLQESITGC
jgi:hypothetical protein